MMADSSSSALPCPLSPLRIRAMEIGFPVVQAALSGYSDWPMRAIARRLGAPYALCEVLLDRFVVEVSTGAKGKRLLRADDEHPCGAQLMGAAPDAFPAAALRLVAAGFDAIDLNFACPVKKVLGRRRGGWLLADPQTALAIVARVRDALPAHVPLSVKLRRAFDDGPASRERFYQIIEGAWRLGVDALTIHGRTVRQRYEGRADWQSVAELKRLAAGRTVLGSGDLYSAEQCLRMIACCGVDGVTAARGAIGNPWIFRQCRDLAAGRRPHIPDLREQREVIAEHYRLAAEHYGPDRCCPRMRKFGIKYARLHPQHQQVRDAFVAATNAEQWHAVLDRWYADESPGRNPDSLASEFFDEADAE